MVKCHLSANLQNLEIIMTPKMAASFGADLNFSRKCVVKKVDYFFNATLVFKKLLDFHQRQSA